MRPIPKEHKKIINADPYYRKCIFGLWMCQGKVDIHHSLIYARKQINELYAYQPMCQTHHNDPESELYAEYLSIKKGLEDLQEKYPKYNWKLRLDYLSMKFGSGDK